jgi:7-keto-8-aminopelargonate synthetase-like enzyme
MVKDLFERIQNNKGPLGKWASQAEGYFVFPKLEGELGPRMQFQGKDILNWSLNDYLGLQIIQKFVKQILKQQRNMVQLTQWVLV